MACCPHLEMPMLWFPEELRSKICLVQQANGASLTRNGEKWSEMVKK